MSEKFTEGPLKIVDRTTDGDRGWIAIVTQDGGHICDIFPGGARKGGSDRRIEEHRANARRIVELWGKP
jgi:hypothetical protein